jgi:hypothetical protein
MVSILAHAQQLVYTLLSLMPSGYQKENLEAMLGLFLQAQGYPLPPHIYQIGVRLHKLHFKLSYHNYFCVVFYLILNECVRLHLVMELTSKFPGARYE